MIFIKNFNNNAALVRDQDNSEWVVIGNGIGFGKKLGDKIDQTKISQRFISVESDTSSLDELADISDQTITITNEIVKLAESQLNAKFDSYRYLVLADHIEFAIQRAGIPMDLADGTTRWSVKKLFPKEYEVSEKSVQIIEKLSQKKLAIGEVIFITYHFLNLKTDTPGLQDTIKITKLIEQIVDIVQYEYGISLDSDSFNFNRFITHLRSFMIQHIKISDENSNELDPAILKLMIAKYPNAYETVEKIGGFLQKKTGWILQPDEKVYLTLHIWRVTHRQVNR